MKPWPTDCIVIVAAKSDLAVIPEGAEWWLERCADCGNGLTVSPRTYNAALANPGRTDRPIRYVCWGCAAHYDIATVEEIHDHRKGIP